MSPPGNTPAPEAPPSPFDPDLMAALDAVATEAVTVVDGPVDPKTQKPIPINVRAGQVRECRELACVLSDSLGVLMKVGQAVFYAARTENNDDGGQDPLGEAIFDLFSSCDPDQILDVIQPCVSVPLKHPAINVTLQISIVVAWVNETWLKGNLTGLLTQLTDAMPHQVKQAAQTMFNQNGTAMDASEAPPTDSSAPSSSASASSMPTASTAATGPSDG